MEPTKFNILFGRVAVNDNDFTIDSIEKKFDCWTQAREFIKKEQKKGYWTYREINPIKRKGLL